MKHTVKHSGVFLGFYEVGRGLGATPKRCGLNSGGVPGAAAGCVREPYPA
jgi:hypothetical protein